MDLGDVVTRMNSLRNPSMEGNQDYLLHYKLNSVYGILLIVKITLNEISLINKNTQQKFSTEDFTDFKYSKWLQKLFPKNALSSGEFK